MRLLVLITLSLAYAAQGAVASERDLRWSRYTNERFGASIEYPTALFPDPADLPENGDGARFSDARTGAVLLVWGSHNSLGQTPYQSICMSGCPGETYKLDQPGLGVSSGLAEGRIYYEKCLVSGGKSGGFHCFRLEYAPSEKALFDPVVSRIAKSLR